MPRSAGSTSATASRVESLALDGERMAGVRTVDAQGTARKMLSADAYAICLGSYTPLLLGAIGRAGARLSGEGVFGDDSHRRTGRGAAR